MSGRTGKVEDAVELVKGTDQIEDALGEFFSRSKSQIDICSDTQSLPAMMKSREILKALNKGKRDNYRMRYLTEVTKENEVYSRELAQMVELRHLEGVTGNFAVSDQREYVGPITADDGKLGQLIYSDAKSLFEQHRFLFDALWERAEPAQARLAELRGERPVVQTRLMGGETEILRSMRKVMAASDELVGCTTVGVLRSLLEVFPEDLGGIVRRKKAASGGVRWVTSVEKEDGDVAMKCLEMGIELRHSSRLPPLSFECSGTALVASIQAEGQGLSMQNVLTSNEPAYVNHFRLVFEEIWKNGVDGKKRMDELSKGLESSNVEIIENAHESTKMAWQMVVSAGEILMMFSSPQAFMRQINADGYERLKETLSSSKAKIKLLIPDDEHILPVIETLKVTLPSVEFRVMNRSLKTKISILIVDRTKTMVFETKDDSKEDLYEALGISTYTESKSLAESYAIIFEGIWKQTELYEQLEIHDKMQRDFVNIAAHELRTPVQAIINYAELAKAYQDNREEYYDKLLKSVLRLHKLTEDILDAARIESRSLQLNKEVFLLNEVLRTAIDEQRRSAAKKDLRLYFEQPEPVFIFGDKTRIGQVLANLLINAVKFTDEGSVRVAARLDKKQGKVVIRVVDTGIGIERSLLPHLFARFMAKSQSGTGLGLFISKSIIEAHGGKIWVERTEVGKGSTFTFELPVSATIPARGRPAEFVAAPKSEEAAVKIPTG